jgi:hypothetical protein
MENRRGLISAAFGTLHDGQSTANDRRNRRRSISSRVQREKHASSLRKASAADISATTMKHFKQRCSFLSKNTTGPRVVLHWRQEFTSECERQKSMNCLRSKRSATAACAPFASSKSCAKKYRQYNASLCTSSMVTTLFFETACLSKCSCICAMHAEDSAQHKTPQPGSVH